MCEQDIREFIYHLQVRPDGIPADFPNREEVLVLTDVFHRKGGPFQRLLDCGGIRFVLLLEFNKDISNCLENTLLQKIYQGLEEKDINSSRTSLSLAAQDCMKSFWLYLNYEFQMRCKNGTLMDPVGPLDYDRKDCHKLQLKTIDRSVCAIKHDKPLDNRSRLSTFENPYPDLRFFEKSRVDILETIAMDVFRVRIEDKEYSLKAGRWDMMCAIEKLRAAPPHPNVLSLSGVIVDAESRIMGMLTPFISGVLLAFIESATTLQKEKWKAKISNAVSFLHNENIVWGDAKPDNIIISSVNDEPVLIDFEGGQTDGWVDENLRDTLEGDVQGLRRILAFVDDLPTNE